MKKIFTVAMLLACLAPVAMAATTEQETVSDPEQGLLINGFWDNWFISLDGGASVFLSPYDNELEFTKRIAPAASLNFGKWWTPVFGTRIGLDYMSANSAALNADAFGFQADGLIDGFDDLYQQRHHGLRPHLDGMVDLVNLFGGYNPNRVYSLIIFGGMGYGYGWEEGQPISDGDWCAELRGGLINSFHVSDAIDINIELKVSKYDSGLTKEGRGPNSWYNLNTSANIGIAYNFPQRGWQAPVIPVVVPVVPKYTDAEGDALVAQLNDANNRIKDLEEDLANANNRIAELEEELENVDRGPLATVYFEINKSNLDRNNRKVIAKIADAIKATPNVKYVVTGYADAETGTDAFNAKLRQQRAEAVYNALIKNGVNADQLTWKASDKSEKLNKFDFTKDRAATIKVVAQ